MLPLVKISLSSFPLERPSKNSFSWCQCGISIFFPSEMAFVWMNKLPNLLLQSYKNKWRGVTIRCGRVGRGEQYPSTPLPIPYIDLNSQTITQQHQKCTFSQFSTRSPWIDWRTDKPTDGWTDKPSYRIKSCVSTVHSLKMHFIKGGNHFKRL